MNCGQDNNGYAIVRIDGLKDCDVAKCRNVKTSKVAIERWSRNRSI